MKRFIAATISLYLVACISLCCIFAAGPQDKINNTEANDIIFTVRKYWPDAERAVSMMQGYSTDYLVTDAEGRMVAASSSGLHTDYVYDFIHKDYSVDILEDGKVLGRIIFINNGEDDFKRKVGVWALAFLAIFLLKDILAVFYLWKHIFDPVKRMNDFAGQIARGNLDIPVVPIGKPLMLSPAFPPASTGHATFTASGAPSSIVSAVIHTHSFTLAKSVCYDLH